MSAAAVVAAVAAAGLALSATGSMLVAAVLLGAATRRWWGAAVPVAVVAVAIRFSTMDFADLAGIQSVVGPAGWTGSGLAVASVWLAAVAVVAATAAGRWDGRSAMAVATVAAGAFAAAIVAGPGPGGSLWIRIVATVVGVGATVALMLLAARTGPTRIGILASACAAASVSTAWASGLDLADGLDRLGPMHALETADHGDAAVVALAFALIASLVLPMGSASGPGRLVCRREDPAIAPTTAPTRRADGHSIHEGERPEVVHAFPLEDDGAEAEPIRRPAPQPGAPEHRVAAPSRPVRLHAGRDRPVRGGRLRGRPGGSA